eukprot:s929_g3.t1
MLISALSALTQLQGCQSGLAMDVLVISWDVPSLFTTVWLLLLGGYAYVMSFSKGPSWTDGSVLEAPEPSFPNATPQSDSSFEDADQGDADDEYSPWSPEGLIQWLYGRCLGQEERAARNHDVAT